MTVFAFVLGVLILLSGHGVEGACTADLSQEAVVAALETSDQVVIGLVTETDVAAALVEVEDVWVGELEDDMLVVWPSPTPEPGTRWLVFADDTRIPTWPFGRAGAFTLSECGPTQRWKPALLSSRPAGAPGERVAESPDQRWARLAVGLVIMAAGFALRDPLRRRFSL